MNPDAFQQELSRIAANDLAVSFRIDKGKLTTDAPWLKVDGFRIFSSNNLDLEGNIRLHGGKNGETFPLRSLLGATFRE